MAAVQADIRKFEDEQAAQPLPAALSTPSISSQIGPSMPSVGGAGRTLPLGMKLPDIITSTPTLERATTGIMDENRRLNQVLPSLQGNVEARRDILQGELEKPMPEAPKLHDMPQFQPRQLSGEELTLFGGIAMALAGLGTKAMRGDLTMALNAAGSAMKGFNEGNLQQAKLDIENFQMKMREVIAQNHKMSEEYRAIIENRKLSLQQKEQMLRVAASSRDDQVMISALNSGQLRTVFDLESHRINAANQASIRSAQIYNTAIEHANRQEPLVPIQGPDGRVIYAPRSQAVGQTVPPPREGDRLTEGEAKGTIFWRQMSSAEEAARALAGPQFDIANLGNQIGVRMAGSDLTNWLAPEKAQQYAQASEQWAEAYLRLKTGAATNADEIKRNARAYFPQPGDEPQTIIQKNQMRAKAIQDVSIVAGRGVNKAPAGGGGGGGMTFATEADAAAAARAGKIKPGDRITVGGQTGTWR